MGGKRDGGWRRRRQKTDKRKKKRKVRTEKIEEWEKRGAGKGENTKEEREKRH